MQSKIAVFVAQTTKSKNLSLHFVGLLALKFLPTKTYIDGYILFVWKVTKATVNSWTFTLQRVTSDGNPLAQGFWHDSFPPKHRYHFHLLHWRYVFVSVAAVSYSMWTRIVAGNRYRVLCVLAKIFLWFFNGFNMDYVGRSVFRANMNCLLKCW